MKKIVAFVLVLLMLSGVNTTINHSKQKINVFASDINEDYHVDISITASEETVFCSELFYFDIIFSNCLNLYDGSFELSYDTGLSFEKYEMLQGLGSVQDDGEKLSIEISKKDGFSDGGVLRVYFRAPDELGSSFGVAVKNPDFGSNGWSSYLSCRIMVYDCKYIEDGGANYCVYKDHAEIQSISPQYQGTVVIPDKVFGVPVTGCSKYMSNSTGVTDFFVSDDSEFLSCHNGVLFNKDGTELILYPMGRNEAAYTVPDTCKVIKSYSFYGEYYDSKPVLQTIEIPRSVTSIEESAIFSNNTIFTISGYADTEAQRYANSNYIRFNDLESEKVQDASLSGICGDDLTWNLSQDGVMTISGTGMMEHFVQSKNCAETPWRSYSYFIKNLIVEEGVMSISNDAFAWSTELESISLPNSLRSLDFQAFYACNSLTDIELPEGLIEIGEECFAGCFLRSIKLPKSLMYIRAEAFADFNLHDGEAMTGLTSIFIPKNVRTVDRAFFGCSDLSLITVDPANNSIFVYDDALYEKNKLTFVPASKKRLRVKEGTYIYDFFYGIDSIESLYIPENVNIDSDLFHYYFNNLESISVSENNQSYASQNGVLYNKDKSCLIYCPQAYKSNVIVLPESTVKISSNAFVYDSVITDIYYTGSEGELELPEYFSKDITIHYNTTFSSVEGDANNDGAVNIADAVMLQKWLLGSESLYNWQNVDLCKDDKIDCFDMILLRRLIVEKSG